MAFNRAADAFYYRRCIVQVGEGVVIAGVEDDYHHFRVTLRHDGKVVTAIAGEPLRVPWTQCPGATEPLKKLIGQPLGTDAWRRDAALDRHHHCTHLLELSLFAMSQAFRQTSRRYDLRVADRATGPQAPPRLVELARNSEVVHSLLLAGDEIVAPALLAGVNIRQLRQWANVHAEDQLFEDLMIIRRGIQVADGRLNSQLVRSATSLKGKLNACYAFQESRIKTSVLMPGYVSVQGNPDLLLVDMLNAADEG